MRRRTLFAAVAGLFGGGAAAAPGEIVVFGADGGHLPVNGSNDAYIADFHRMHEHVLALGDLGPGRLTADILAADFRQQTAELAEALSRLRQEVAAKRHGGQPR